MRNGKTYPIWFAVGALVIYTALFVVPSLIGIGYSFTDWSAYTTDLHFVGFENFKLIFSADENYMKIIKNTLMFTLLTTVLKNVLGLLLAVLLFVPRSNQLQSSISGILVHASFPWQSMAAAEY